MEDLTLFNSLDVVENPKFFDNGNTVEFRVVKSYDKNTIPGTFKLRCHRPLSITIQTFVEGFRSIRQGDIVTACGIPDAYRSKFYGKKGKPVKASNGKWYYANRNRFYVQKIKKGAYHPEVIEFAYKILAGYLGKIEKEA